MQMFASSEVSSQLGHSALDASKLDASLMPRPQARIPPTLPSK
jgi:hypothetical protein